MILRDQQSSVRTIPEVPLSLGIRLLASIAKPTPSKEDLIVRIEGWLRIKYSDMFPQTRHGVVDSVPILFCRLHPAAEELEISLVNHAQIVASANTTTVGPGYHIFVTNLLKDLATEFGAQWERPAEDDVDYGDETGYFFSDDQRTLYAEMTSWLAAIADSASDSSEGKGYALCLPPNPQFEVQQPVWTPLGPRNREWLSRTAQDGNSGTDFFAWWSPGFDAEYYFRRALGLMWVDVRWRSPVNDFERLVLEDVAYCLGRAYELDSGRQYPWAEWQQILGFLNVCDSNTALVDSRAQAPPVIGYRRGNVTVTLPGGWQIKVPGSFSEFEPDDDYAFSSIDPPTEIWFTAYRSEAATASTFESLRSEMNKTSLDLTNEGKNFFAQAAIKEKLRDSGEKYFVLSSSNQTIGGRSVCTILFSDPAQKDWAVETWRSLRPPRA